MDVVLRKEERKRTISVRRHRVEVYITSIGRLHMTSHISRQKKWLTKSYHFFWKGIGRTPTFWVILKTNLKIGMSYC